MEIKEFVKEVLGIELYDFQVKFLEIKGEIRIKCGR